MARGLLSVAPAWRLALGLLVAAVVLHGTAVVRAQEDEVSAADRRAAAEAYDRGSAAYLERQWGQAARYFEMADRLAPSPAALVQAVRAHQRAGNDIEAANLALRLEARHPDERAASRTAASVLREAEQRFVRVDVQCDGCSLQIDRAVIDQTSFFVEPRVTHTLTASFETGDVQQTVEGTAGSRQELSFEAPPAPAPSTEPAAGPTPPPDTAPPASDGGGGLSPVWVVAGGVVTLGLAGALTWSGLDALDGVDGYEADPTQERLEEGQAKERRTNVLIGATAGAAAVTLLLAALTDWGGSGETDPTIQASAGVVPGGVIAVLGGRL